MTVRNSPFAEWDIVYWEPSSTDVDTMLARLRAEGCPNAAHVAEVSWDLDAGGALVLGSPVSVPGDWLWLTTEGAQGTLELGDAWLFAHGEPTWNTHPEAGVAPIAVPEGVQGELSIPATFTPEEGEPQELELGFDVVELVG